MQDLVNGWRLVVSNIENINDPSEVEYTFMLFVEGKVYDKSKTLNGFCHNANEDLETMLKGQLEALKKPHLLEHKSQITYNDDEWEERKKINKFN